MYKMSKINKEAYKQCEIETIDKGKYFWLSRRETWKQNTVTVIGQQLFTNVIQISKNTDMN